MIENELKNIIEKHKLEERSISAFWDTFKVYRNEQIEEFNSYFINYNEDKLFISINYISLKLGNWPECNYNHIIVNIPIYYDEKILGNYQVLFSLDGQIDDDFFTLY